MNYRKQWTSVSDASAGGVKWVLKIGYESCWWSHGQKCNEASLETGMRIREMKQWFAENMWSREGGCKRGGIKLVLVEDGR